MERKIYECPQCRTLVLKDKEAEAAFCDVCCQDVPEGAKELPLKGCPLCGKTDKLVLDEQHSLLELHCERCALDLYEHIVLDVAATRKEHVAARRTATQQLIRKWNTRTGENNDDNN